MGVEILKLAYLEGKLQLTVESVLKLVSPMREKLWCGFKYHWLYLTCCLTIRYV